MSAQSSVISYAPPGSLHPRNAIAERWRRWWFEPVSPVNLGVCRVLFFGLLFAWVAGWPYASWATLPRSFFRPVWLFEFFHLPVLPYRLLLAAEVAWKASLVLACVGLFTRAATLWAAVSGLYLIGLQYNYGKTDHLTGVFLFTTGIMALSRCGDALSIDALIRRRRDPSPVPPSGEYRWPVRMVWVLMSTLFFAAGMAKVIRGGVPWVASDNFAVLLVQRQYMTSLPALDWGLWVAKHPWLFKPMAAGSICAELFLFTALFDRRLRAVLPYALLSMQIGIGLFMRVWFTPYMVCYLFWVPWDKVIEVVRGRRGSSAQN